MFPRRGCGAWSLDKGVWKGPDRAPEDVGQHDLLILSVEKGCEALKGKNQGSEAGTSVGLLEPLC